MQSTVDLNHCTHRTCLSQNHLVDVVDVINVADFVDPVN